MTGKSDAIQRKPLSVFLAIQARLSAHAARGARVRVQRWSSDKFYSPKNCKTIKKTI